MNYTKINLCGAQGTGKTTVLKALQEDENFKGWNFYTGIVREKLSKEDLKINEQGNAESQHKIYEEYSKLLDSMRSDIPAVSDRCIIDVASYTAWLYDNLQNGKASEKEIADLSSEDFSQRRDIVRRKYELQLVVYFPIEFEIEDDGIRSIDQDYQKGIDAKIQQFLNNYKIPHITVRGSVKERVNQIKIALGLNVEEEIEELEAEVVE